MDGSFSEQDAQRGQQVQGTHPTTCSFFTTVTSFSKILAAIFFVMLPFVGFFLGIEYGKSLEVPSVIFVVPQPASYEEGISSSTDSLVPVDQVDPEVNLPTETPAVGECVVTNCHGLDITCGIVTEQIECTMVYQLGDGCRRFANCEKVGNACTPVLSQRFVDCKSCVEACETRHKSDGDPMDIFECESACVQ